MVLYESTNRPISIVNKTVSIHQWWRKISWHVLHSQRVNGVASDRIDAYVVVYSIEDRTSFATAMHRLRQIRSAEGRHVAVILVANKTDLVRRRVIPELGEWHEVTAD